MPKFIDILYRRPFLLLVFFLVLAYLPVFLPFFHLKNDLISQNLPTRYVISESLYSGYFPWWNSYINFGIPQYGDMNNGFWNPLMWLIARTFGYNIWTITYEEMFYILIGGWGVYRLCRELDISKGIAILGSLSYMSCGYTVGHLQHLCWITGTAFFPYVVLFLLKINKNPVLKNYVVGAFGVFLFVASTHPGLVIGAAYFFLLVLIAIYLFRNSYTSRFYNRKFLLVNLAFIILGMVFSIGVVISDVDVLLHISRGSKLSLSESLLAPTTLQSYLSILFPLAVNKSAFFATDISMRNVFMGIGCLVGLVVSFRYFNKGLIIVCSALLFFILLASGGIFKKIFYYILPFIGYVRMNGEFAYFTQVILIMTGCFGLQRLFRHVEFEILLKRILSFFILLSLVGIIIAIIALLMFPASGHHFSMPTINNVKFSARSFIDNLRFADLLLTSAVIQLASFLLMRTSSSSLPKMALVLSINLIVNTWLALPFTGLGMKSKKQVHDEMSRFPRGIIAQELRPLNKTEFLDSNLRSEFILLGSYTKKIGYPKEEQYPVELKHTLTFFNDSSLHDFILQQSFIFLSTDTTKGARTEFDSSALSISKLGPGFLQVTVDNKGYRFITFLQNDYPYWQTFINGHVVKHYTAFKTFMTLPIQSGRQEIKFVFDPRPIRRAVQINVAIFLIGLVSLFFPGARNFRLVH